MAEQNTGTEKDIVFHLEKIYIKDVSYEAPGAPVDFMQQEGPAPQLNVQLGIEHAPLNPEQGFFEVVLAVTATTTRNDKTLFLVELQQAGVFQITGLTGEALEKTLEIGCTHILLPFAREAINDLVSKGGFPQLLLSPINFEALYEQKKAAQKKQVQQ